MLALKPLPDINALTDQPISAPSAATTLTLATVLQDFEQWRSAKTYPGEPIPDALWQQIFALADTIAPTKLRVLFNVSNAQYQKKWHELHANAVLADAAPTIPAATLSPTSATFCEARTAPPAYQPAAIPKAIPPLVIEFKRADGCLMKVYSSADRFTDLLTQFFAGDTHAAHPGQP